MRNDIALKALCTADVLKMRGRGSGCYDYQDYTEYDAGCFDWDVECVAEAPQEYDFEHDWGRLNIGDEEYVDERPMAEDPSASTQRGMEVIDSLRNGDNLIVMSDTLKRALDLTSTGITAHAVASEALQEASNSSTELAALGKFAKGVGWVGTGLGLFLSIADLTDGNATAQDKAMFAASLAGVAVGFYTTAPLWVIGIPVVMTFAAYALPDDGDQSKTGY